MTATVTRRCHCNRFRFGQPYRERVDCRECWLYHHDATHRAKQGGGPLPTPPPAVARREPHRRPCRHLGDPTGDSAPCFTCPSNTHAAALIPLLACAVHGRTTGQRGAAHHKSCHGCKEYEFPLPPPFVAHADDPPAGVVIGTYTEWPALIELQIKLIRQHCGGAPILIADDVSPAAAALQEICGRYEGVRYWSNAQRIGHSGGDLSALWKGLTWGQELGLKVVAKLSQRYLVDRSRWIYEGAKELLASGLPLGAQRCRGRENFPHRTEAMILNVAAWTAPDVMEYLRPKAVGTAAEYYFARLYEDRFGGRFHPWTLLGSEDRYQRTAGVVWHCSNAPQEYHDLAAAYGLTLPPDFHTDGWQRDYGRGRYLLG